jgi:uncharacterized membrane protein
VATWVGPVLLALGVLLVLAGMIVSARSSSHSRVGGGALLIVGPIPIAISSDRKWALALMLLALALTVIWILFWVYM